MFFRNIYMFFYAYLVFYMVSAILYGMKYNKNRAHRFKRAPRGYPIDRSSHLVYLNSSWLNHSGYEDGGTWVHTYKDKRASKTMNAYYKAKANREEYEFNKRMG